MKTFTKKTYLLGLLLAGSYAGGYAQVKIGDNPTSINSNSLLELESSGKGLLLPRVALSATNAASPMSAFVAGMAVYNTATAGTGSTAVTPGYYFSDGSVWVRLADAAAVDPSKDSWVDDNANTQVKLGTLSDAGTVRPDSLAFVIKDNGRVGIGLVSPAGVLDVNGKVYVNNRQTVYNADALNVNHTGSLFVGNGGQNQPAGATTLQSKRNTGVGIGALDANTTASENTAVGYNALNAASTGGFNTAIGSAALSANGTGSQNSAVGTNSLSTNSSGYSNAALGYNTLQVSSTGYGNSAVGAFALVGNTTGFYNTSLGYNSLNGNTTGAYNIAIGYNALYSNVTGSQGVAIGRESQRYANNTGTPWANFNTSVGYQSMMGSGVPANNTGNYNTALGSSSLKNVSSSPNNTVIGWQAGFDLGTGNGNNTFLGNNTGRGIVTGERNTVLGANVIGLDAALSNNIIIADGGGVQRIRVLDNGNMGVGTVTPQKSLHVSGSVQVTGELNVGGDATTAGSAGTSGQILVSNGAGAAPSWKSNSVVSGTIANAIYVQGTTAATTTTFGVSATAIDVPGVTYTHIVPAGTNQTLLFTVTGYAVRSATVGGEATQGVFSLLQDGAKISSAYGASGDFGNLENVPICVTMMKSVTLAPGTYTFKVQYKAWFGNQTVNYLPSGFGGYSSDTEAMLTKMQVLVYNN